VERVLAGLGEQVPAGLLVWSFYEDPRTEEFLRVACDYLAGAADVPAGGRLERLQQALASDLSHLLVLDGLERVQAEGHDGRARTFDRGEAAADDPKAARLGRILGEYAQALDAVERDLLARLAAFPRGVKVALLAFLAEAEGAVAGALAGCNAARLVRLLER